MPYGDDNGFDASFDSELLEPPHMPAAGGLGGEDSGDEFETDSCVTGARVLRGRVQVRLNSRTPRAFIKKTASTPDLSLSGGFEKPFAGRIVPTRTMLLTLPRRPRLVHSPSTMTHISSSTAGCRAMDGVGAKTDSPVSASGSRSGDLPPRSASPGSIQHAAVCWAITRTHPCYFVVDDGPH